MRDGSRITQRNAQSPETNVGKSIFVLSSVVKATSLSHILFFVFASQVEGLDDDNGRVIVKLALGGSAATVNESFISLVTKKEYARDGKLLSKYYHCPS